MSTPDRLPSARSEQRRREACDAAVRVIVRNGLQVTTLRDIGREAGFTTGVLMHHFPDKAAVISATFAAVSDDFIAEAGRRLRGASSPTDRLVELVAVALPASDARRAEWRVWSEMWTYAGRDPEFAAQVVATDARWEAEIAAVLEDARAAGVIRDVDVAAETALLARLVDGLGMRAWLTGRWDEARLLLVRHVATLGVADEVLERMREPAPTSGGGMA